MLVERRRGRARRSTGERGQARHLRHRHAAEPRLLDPGHRADLLHVRIVGPPRSADAANAEAATCELATYDEAKESARSGDKREGSRGRRFSHGYGNAYGRGDRAPNVRRELLVHGRDAPQVVDTERRVIARGGGVLRVMTGALSRALSGDTAARAAVPTSSAGDWFNSWPSSPWR